MITEFDVESPDYDDIDDDLNLDEMAISKWDKEGGEKDEYY